MDGAIKVLRWDEDFDGPWSPAAERKYVEGGFNGLSLGFPRGARLESLEFLRRLPGLRGFSLNARVRDDTEPFRIQTMQSLALITGSRRVIPDVTQPDLASLMVADRPGLVVNRHWPSLARLCVVRWKGTDLRLVEGASHLKDLDLDARHQAGTLDGVESCRSLESLKVTSFGVQDTAPLRSLDRLVYVTLAAAPPTVRHARINLADICKERLERLRIVGASKIEGLELLAGCRGVKEVALAGCDLTPADLEVLAALPIARRLDVH